MLDYGCGNAALALALAEEFGLTVHACDVDADLIADLRRRHGGAVDSSPFPRRPAPAPCRRLRLGGHLLRRARAHAGGAAARGAPGDPPRPASGRRPRRHRPHKRLLAIADPENVKFHFPRLHRAVFSLVNGRAKYRRIYGGDRFANFSAGHAFHVRFSAAELTGLLAEAGFKVDQVRYYRLLYPLIRAALWLSEGLVGRLPGASRLRDACWKAYWWDAGLEPGKLANDIGVRARPRARRVSSQK